MFQDSAFALPENPIARAYEDCGGLGDLGYIKGGLGVFAPYAPGWTLKGQNEGLGACCSSCSGSDHNHGMGSLQSTFDDLQAKAFEPSPVFDLPWVYVIGGAALLFFLFGTRVEGSEYRYERAKASRDYKRKMRELKDEYPTKGRRAGQVIGEGYQRAKRAGSFF